jgi:hypothetical protein
MGEPRPKMRQLAALRITAALVAVLACGYGGTEPERTPEFFPLTVGNQWTYHRLDSILVQSPPLVSARTFTARVKDTARLNGLMWAQVVDPGHFFDCCDSLSYVRHGIGGIVRLVDGPLNNGLLVLPFPAQVGQRAFGMIVRSLDTAITVPAGVFHTVHLAPDDSIWPYEYFVAPDVGVVKRVTRYRTRDSTGALVPAIVIVERLSSYSVKP